MRAGIAKRSTSEDEIPMISDTPDELLSSGTNVCSIKFSTACVDRLPNELPSTGFVFGLATKPNPLPSNPDISHLNQK